MALTIANVIEILDRRYPNAYEFEDKRSWILACDRDIFNICHLLHPIKDFEFNAEAYDDDSHVVILGSEWVDIYIDYLMAQIHYSNGEYDRANNCTLSYNNNLEKYHNWLRANNMPSKQDPIIKVWG